MVRFALLAEVCTGSRAVLDQTMLPRQPYRDNRKVVERSENGRRSIALTTTPSHVRNPPR